MKYLSEFKVLSILALSVLICFSSCKEDEPEDPFPGTDYELRYDGGNDTAPPLPAGNFETGIRFNGGANGNISGVELFAVRYFIRNKPNSAELNVYSGGTGEPDILLYSESITNEISSSSWNDHTLSTPIVLDGDDLWITISYNQSNNDRVIGCDSGPRNNGGDWHFDGQLGVWDTFGPGFGGDAVNWNIRGQIRE